jgi:exonuclease III
MDPGQVERLQQICDSTVAMRLVSWNVNGRYGPALKKQIELVGQADPALVCLQQVRSESVDAWTTALEAKGLTVETTRHLVGERTYFLLLAHGGRQVERKPARSFEVPHPELVLSLLIELYGEALKVITTHVPNGSANGWRKVEHLEGVYGYLARSHTPGHHRVLCGDFNCPRAERDGRVYTWAERHDKRFIPDRGLRWDAAERAVILGLAAFDMHDVYRAAARLGGASVGEKGSHVTRGTTVERRYDHVFASEGLRPWVFAYRHDVPRGRERSATTRPQWLSFDRLAHARQGSRSTTTR